MTFRQHLVMLKEYLKMSLATAMEYRFNFMLEIGSMILNDMMWVSFWWIFFNKFPVVNEWVFNDIIIMYAIVNLSWGLNGVIFGNRNQLAKIIAEGRLDFYLNLPKNELFHVIIGKSSWFSMGDIIFGLIMAFISLELVHWPLFLLLTFFSMILFLSFNIIAGSLSFFIGNAEESSHQLNMTMIAFSSYPLPIFNDVAKLILLTIIPAGFIASIPIQLLKSFDWTWFLLLILASIVFLVLAIVIFRIGVRRYESGSMITLRG